MENDFPSLFLEFRSTKPITPIFYPDTFMCRFRLIKGIGNWALIPYLRAHSLGPVPPPSNSADCIIILQMKKLKLKHVSRLARGGTENCVGCRK